MKYRWMQCRPWPMYRRNGYQIIGFDLYAYSNADPERREVRIEMGKKRICAEKCVVSGEY